MPNPSLIKSYVAEAAVLPYRIVKLGTADGQVVQAAAATDAAIGIADNLGQASAGYRVEVIHEGIAEIEAGAAITRGALLMADASGRGITATASAGSNVAIVGRALNSAAAAGEIVNVLVSIGTFQG